MSAASELQKAVHAALTGDAGLTALLGGPDVFDQTPPSAAFPYATYGKTDVFDWSTATENGSEILFTLHVWSRERGRAQALAIMDTVGALLNDQPLAVAGHNLIGLQLQSAETGYDDDVAVHHGTMRFRAVLEPAA